jgi:hypothetical protein
MNTLINQLQSLDSANADATELLISQFIKIQFKKGMVLGAPERPSSFLYFVAYGLMKGVYVFKNTEYPSWVADHGFIPSIKAPAPQQSFQEFLHVLEDTCVWQLDLRMAEKAAKTNKGIRAMLDEISYNSQLLLKEGEILLRIPSAALRYRIYMQGHEQVAGKIHNDLIAALLRITIKHFSKIKRDYLISKILK